MFGKEVRRVVLTMYLLHDKAQLVNSFLDPEPMGGDVSQLVQPAPLPDGNGNTGINMYNANEFHSRIEGQMYHAQRLARALQECVELGLCWAPSNNLLRRRP